MGRYDNFPKWDKNAPIVAFNKEGHMTNYLYGDIEWKRVYPFKSAMKIIDWYGTNSSAIITVMDNQGIQYPVYISDFFEVLTRAEIKAGYIEEMTWKFRKIGSAYCIMLDL